MLTLISRDLILFRRVPLNLEQLFKIQLVEEGFNPAVTKDRLYFLGDEDRLYVQMTQDIYNSVKNHDFKLHIKKICITFRF